MKRKLISGALAGLAAACSAEAATVTYVLSPNDDGTGNVAAGKFAVYAYTSAGDNAGLALFSFTVSGQTTTVNRSPRALFVDEDGNGFGVFGDNRNSGFIALRFPGSSGVATSGSVDAFTGEGLNRYGVGQTAGDLNTAKPAGYTAAFSASEMRYGATNSFTLANVFGYTTFTGGQVPVLLATGTYSAFTFPSITAGAANTFSTAMNGTTDSATVQTIVRGTIPEPAGLVAMAVTGAALARRRARERRPAQVGVRSGR